MFRSVAAFFLAILHINGYAQSAQKAADAPEFWLWSFLGRLHPLAVHFPVSLLLIAAILELITIRNFNSRYRAGINLLVIAGAISAVISVAFGWLLAGSGEYGEDLLDIHEWTGMATAGLGLAAVLILFLNKERRLPSLVKTYRAILFITALGVSVAGHYGSSLTHGKDYLSSALPWSKEYIAPVDFAQFASVDNDTSKLNAQQTLELSVQVRGIFAHNCYKCHGAQKVKGDLRLDSKTMAFRGGESGVVIIPGKPQDSDLFRRITLPKGHEDIMPSEGKQLTGNEIRMIKFWIQKGAPWPEAEKDKLFRVAELAPRNPALPAGLTANANPVDMWVSEYYKKNKIGWTKPVDDKTFLKRIYFDLIGLMPSYQDQISFATDTRPDKRTQWVNKLLSQDEDYALHWLTFWNDALRNDYTGTGYVTEGRFDITNWLYSSLLKNKPYDQFVKELISPDKDSKGFIKGIQWRGVINASQRTEMQAAQNVAQVFLGLNLKCASCHNSFVSNWKLDQAYGFANIFADSSMEINRCDKPTGKFTGSSMLWKELGSIDSTAKSEVKQQQLADLMVKPDNGRLYRTIVNRMWAQLMGRGLIEPVDVMDNEPWSQDLLDWMASNFVQNKYDIKQLICLVATSNAYQQPSVGFKRSEEIMQQNFQFRGMLRKRMTAEQFSDAVGQIIGPVFPDSVVKYNPYASSAVVKHAYNRASTVVNNTFLTALGRPNRENVSTGRESQANLLQALELTNGERFNEVLERGAEQWKKEFGQTDMIVREMFRRALSREPSEAEFNSAKAILGSSPGTEAIADFFWAILLLPEFQIIY
ncbi:MAG: PSD1 and planctomycete cytochrome C domain-containing protein [Flavitalea sp.]